MKYGKLKIINGIEGKTKDLHECICDCGAIVQVLLNSLRSGNTESCGCIHKENLSKRRRKHLGKGTTEYNSWSLMRDRCNNPNNKSYSYYGARGIRVCVEWDDFTVFLYDMGFKPDRSYSIDRIDNNKDYTSKNCKWSTMKEQVRNRNITVKYNIEGVEKPLAEWCEIYGMKYITVYKRIYDGMSIKKALTTKKRRELSTFS